MPRERTKILVVDDQEIFLLAIKTMLEGMDLELVTAMSGPQALEAAMTNDFAVILLDVRMPGMDGFATAERLRRIKRAHGVPIVFVTADSSDRKIEFRGYDTGAVDFLVKPVDSRVLRGKVKVFVTLYEQKVFIERQRDLSMALSGSKDMDSALNHCLDAAFSVAGVEAVAMFLGREDGELELARERRVESSGAQRESGFDFESALQTLLDSGEPLAIDQDGLAEEGNERLASATPIIYQDRVLACIGVMWSGRRRFNEGGMRSMQALGVQMGSVISRILAREESSRAQENFQALFDRVEDFIFIFDDQARILAANPAVRQAAGIDPEAGSGTSMFDVHPERFLDEMRNCMHGLKESDQGTCEIPMLSRDGGEIPVETQVTRGKWDGEDAFFAVSRDMTDRFKLEANLDWEANLNKSVAELARDILLAADAKDVARMSLQTALGLARARNGAVFIFTNMDDPGQNPVRVDCPGQEGMTDQVEAVFTKALGRVLELKAPYASSGSGEDGVGVLAIPALHEKALLGVMCLAREGRGFSAEDRKAMDQVAGAFALGISRKLAEARMASAMREKDKARQNLEAVFKSIPDAIVTVDKDMRILDFNEAFGRICGLGQDLEPCERGDMLDRCHCHKALKQALESGGGVKEYRVKCQYGVKPGQVVVLSSAPLAATDTTEGGAVLLVRDITRLADLENELAKRSGFGNMVGKSRRMREVYDLVEQLASVDTTVLVTGESGTGKELVAEALHYSGTRESGPLVKVNCSALSENLLESELFGHVRGAFSGAVRERVGRFEAAEGGTIFLDEVGDIPPRIQLMLLRFMEYKQFERVGDSRTRSANVRIVTATNVDLQDKVAKGYFRRDLYYRLMVMHVHLPPLRERTGDIPLLVEHFLAEFGKSMSKDIAGVDQDVMGLFLGLDWLGNVRELKHALEHACVLCPGGLITREHLPQGLIVSGAQVPCPPMPAPALNRTAPARDISARDLANALDQADGNKALASRILGISRPTLYRKLRRFSMD